MTGKPSRLEAIIVLVALLVLALASREPRSGSAYMGVDAGEDGQTRVPADPRREEQFPGERANSQTAAGGSPHQAGQTPPDYPHRVKRMARVDARNARHLGYPEIMYGEITVRWVWNGSRLVPRKVVEVKEPDGTVTIWSFEDQDNVTITELPPEYVPAD